MDLLLIHLPKCFDFLIDSSSKLTKKVTLPIKTYILIFILLSIAINSYLTAKYNLKIYGAIFNLNYVMHNLMQFLLVFRSSEQLTIKQVSQLLNQVDQEGLKRVKISFVWCILAFALFLIISAFAYFMMNHPREIYLLVLGFEADQLVNLPIGSFFVFVGVVSLINLLLTLTVFCARYLLIVHAISLFSKQNLTFIDSLLSSETNNLAHGFLMKIEDLYLLYKQLVEKVNASYGHFLFWLLMVLYTTITSFGILIVMWNGESVLLNLIARNVSFIVTILIFTLCLINKCNKSYYWMEEFRQKGLRLVNLHLRRSQIRDPMCECLSNTLRGIPLMRMRAGQMYTMEHPLLISLISSAIPTTVMVVSLIREQEMISSSLNLQLNNKLYN